MRFPTNGKLRVGMIQVTLFIPQPPQDHVMLSAILTYASIVLSCSTRMRGKNYINNSITALVTITIFLYHQRYHILSNHVLQSSYFPRILLTML